MDGTVPIASRPAGAFSVAVLTVLFVILLLATWVWAWPMYEAAARLGGSQMSWALPVTVVMGEMTLVGLFGQGILAGKHGAKAAGPFIALCILCGVMAAIAHGAAVENFIAGTFVGLWVTVIIPLACGSMAALCGQTWQRERARAMADRRAQLLARTAM